MKLDTRTAASPLGVVHASSTVVIAHDTAGAVQVYVATPVGWRLRREPGRHDGELVVQPALMAMLDAAAAGAS